MASLSVTSLSMTTISSSIIPSLGSCFRVTNPSSVSLSTKGKRFPSITMQPGTSHFRFVCAAKPETVEKVCTTVKRQLALGDDQVVTVESKFIRKGMPRLTLKVEIVMGLKEEFGISVEEDSTRDIVTIHDAADIIVTWKDLLPEKDMLLETDSCFADPDFPFCGS